MQRDKKTTHGHTENIRLHHQERDTCTGKSACYHLQRNHSTENAADARYCHALCC
nr:MAG TPA: hypothetical protein [Caudoviricetes sp.]